MREVERTASPEGVSTTPKGTGKVSEVITVLQFEVPPKIDVVSGGFWDVRADELYIGSPRNIEVGISEGDLIGGEILHTQPSSERFDDPSTNEAGRNTADQLEEHFVPEVVRKQIIPTYGTGSHKPAGVSRGSGETGLGAERVDGGKFVLYPDVSPRHEDDDLITDMFQQAGRYPLFDKDLEQLVFRRLKNGDGINDLKSDPNFWKKFEGVKRELAQNLLDDSRSLKDVIMLANLRLVFKTVKPFRGYLSYAELIQEGNIGMMRAVELFDPNRDTKFSTYATPWIMQAALRAIGNTGRPIRIPIHALDVLKKANHYITEREQVEGEIPTRKELTKYLKNCYPGIDIAELIKTAEAGSLVPTASLDEPITTTGSVFDGDDYTIESILPDPNVDVEKSVIEVLDSDREMVEEILERLPQSFQRVLRLQLGVDGKELSNQEIANTLRVTTERVRIIREKAWAYAALLRASSA